MSIFSYPSRSPWLLLLFISQKVSFFDFFVDQKFSFVFGPRCQIELDADESRGVAGNSLRF